MTTVSFRRGDHGNVADLTPAAERGLDSTALDRFFELQQDAERASAHAEATVDRKIDTAQSYAAAKSERLRAKEQARDMGQDLPEDMDAPLRRREEAEERASDAANADAKEARQVEKGKKSLVSNVASTINAAALALNKANKSEVVRNDLGEFGDTVREKLTWRKPDPVKFPISRPTVKPPKGGDWRAFVDSERSKQDAWRSEREETKKAFPGIPASTEEVLTPFRPYLEQPDFEVREFAGKFTGRFPLAHVDAESLSGRTVPVAPDFRPSWVKEHWEEIEAEVTRQVTAIYDAKRPKVMTEDEKRKALDRLDAKIRESESLECEAIWQAREQGVHIAFRPDTTPAAVLGIEIPAPAKRRR